MTKRPQNTEIEAGDIVEVVAVAHNDSKGYTTLHGVFDMEWMNNGVRTFTVLFDGDEFAYATEIKLIKKGN